MKVCCSYRKKFRWVSTIDVMTSPLPDSIDYLIFWQTKIMRMKLKCCIFNSTPTTHFKMASKALGSHFVAIVEKSNKNIKTSLVSCWFRKGNSFSKCVSIGSIRCVASFWELVEVKYLLLASNFLVEFGWLEILAENIFLKSTYARLNHISTTPKK